ncbi:restriction endonuclease subunit S [Candidatus Minimicrobia sp. QA0096]|uniref:restriction endonuclease subunit S n=1 Tax=Candidatus Minimicrobia sp. QA0096 TaxID=3118470 RepID=UPI0030D0CB9D
MTDNNVNWKKARIKDVSTPYTGNSIKDEHKDLYIDNINAIPYISTKDINDKFQTIDFDNGLFIKNSDKSFRRAPKNSTLLCIEGGNAGKKIAFNDRTVCFVNKLCCFHSKTENNKFLYYFLMSPSFTEEFKSRITGLIGGVSVSVLRNIHIRLPALDEQEKIADFLDEKCAEIDRLSEDIQKQIDILNDYKKSVITRAVTKGLDPNAEMKDSGVQWIGKIPEKWTVIPVKYCFDIENGSDPKTDYGDTPVYGSGSKSFKKCVEFKKGPTVLLGRKGTVNIPQYVTGNYWNVDTAFNTKPKGNYDLKLFYYAACSFDYENYSTQTALPSMTQSNYYNFKLPLMSQDEQEQIVTFLDDKCTEIDESINSKQGQITKLDTYKKSIIYEYVTGKKRVV